MSKRRNRAQVSLPKGVHRVIARGREYFYFQTGRGTDHQGERIKLPNDPHSPEFWNAIRQAQGLVGPVPTDTIGALIDAYEAAWPSLPRKLAESTQQHYRRHLDVVRTAWGSLPANSLQPHHVQALIERIGADKPGRANNVLDALRSMSSWAIAPTRRLLTHDPTHGVAHFEQGEGHRPWTPVQLEIAQANFTGMIRRAFFLSLYTGQRISDVVRLGWTDIDDGTITLRQKKTGVQPWCPIFPELESEMATWEKRPGPFLFQDNGRPFRPNSLWKAFDRERASHPDLAGAVWHGLRANAVIRLRQDNYSHGLISDMIGMSVQMVERYSRHADRKAGAKAVLIDLKERKEHNTVKRWKTGK